MQIRINLAVMLIWVISILSLWVFGQDTCTNWATVYLGVIPLMLVATPVVAAQVFMAQPRIPSDSARPPNAMLQQFAWTARSKARKLTRAKGAMLELDCECSDRTMPPMFCVETAIKAFFWATMIYDYTEAEGHRFENLPESVKTLLGEVEEAMALFSLERRHLFYDREHETKVVVAWNRSMILVCIRGSIATANFIDDAKVCASLPCMRRPALRSSRKRRACTQVKTQPRVVQFLQMAHPPRRSKNGRVPRVHRGFQQTWQANGIRDRVLQHVSLLLSSAEDRGSVQVLTCGHSLGGAVATLAAFDIARECSLSPAQVRPSLRRCFEVASALDIAGECSLSPAQMPLSSLLFRGGLSVRGGLSALLCCFKMVSALHVACECAHRHGTPLLSLHPSSS